MLDDAHLPSPQSRGNVTIRQLRAFVALAKTKNFTAAAKHMHVTQSALSALVRELESEVGSRLFDRTTRNVEFSAAGVELLPTVLRVLSDLEDGLMGLRDLSLKNKGRVTVAVTPLLAASLVPALCAALRDRFPDLRVIVRDRLASENIDCVRSGEADLAIGNFGPMDDDISLTPIQANRVGAVLPCTHTLSRRRSLRWVELASEPLILVNNASSFRQVVEHALSRANISPRVAFEVAYMGTAIGLAHAGMGVAICPSHTVTLLDRKLARFVPLILPSVTDGIYIATRKGRSLSPAAQAFVDVTLEGRARWLPESA